MITGKISARYAKALYKFAEEQKQEETVYNEMKIVANSFMDVPELNEALSNPTLSADKKKALLITAAGTQVCAEFKRFVDLVVEHKREEYFQSIISPLQTHKKQIRLLRYLPVHCTHAPFSAIILLTSSAVISLYSPFSSVSSRQTLPIFMRFKYKTLLFLAKNILFT